MKGYPEETCAIKSIKIRGISDTLPFSLDTQCWVTSNVTCKFANLEVLVPFQPAVCQATKLELYLNFLIFNETHYAMTFKLCFIGSTEVQCHIKGTFMSNLSIFSEAREF
jgi:hypothetical protein